MAFHSLCQNKCFKMILHIAYKLKVKIWQITQNICTNMMDVQICERGAIAAAHHATATMAVNYCAPSGPTLPTHAETARARNGGARTTGEAQISGHDSRRI